MHNLHGIMLMGRNWAHIQTNLARVLIKQVQFSVASVERVHLHKVHVC
jgi:hypothetical protein